MLRSHAAWLTLAVLLLGSCGGGGGGSAPADEEAPVSQQPPNILLLIADDFGLDAASFDPDAPWYDVGDTTDDPEMPTIAALCAEGVRFTNAWAAPVCAPTRATILTGTYPHQHGVVSVGGGSPSLDLDSWTLPKALTQSAADYDLASFGKWHVSRGLDDPNTAGWPEFAGTISGGLPDYADWTRVHNGVEIPTTTYATTSVVNDAIQWISTRGDKPWLMWLGFNAPHTPFHEPPSDLHTQGALGPFQPGDDNPWFVAMCEALDTEIGRLKAELIARGEWENTVVIFIGDNGTANSVVDPIYGNGGKGTISQGGLQVPFVIAGPGIANGGRASDAIVSVVDLFSTIIELAGLDPEAERSTQAPTVTLDSRSLIPLLENTAGAVNDTVLGQRGGGTAAQNGFAIRSLGHKLIVREDGAIELYDLGIDPFEATDLYDDAGAGPAPGYAAIYITLRDALRAKVGDPLLGT